MGNEKIFLSPIRTGFIGHHETASQRQVDTTAALSLATKEFHDGLPDFLELSLRILRFNHVLVSLLLLPVLVQVELIFVF